MSLPLRAAGSMAIVGAALVALAAGCGRTGLYADLLLEGADAAGVADGAALDGSCACPSGQRCVDGACVNEGISTGVVLFGWTGVAAPNFWSSTWAWDGTNWNEQDVVGPSSRNNASMAKLNDLSVLFGGSSSGPTIGFLSDTWVWNGSWVQQSVTGPNARDSAAMATLGNAVVLFGGLGLEGVQGDTWTWDGASWTQVDTPGPGARSGHAMATLHDRVVLFGGKDGDVNVPGGPMMGDTWTWDGTSWTQLDVRGPSARISAAMATLDDTVVLFGGMDESGNILGDTWTWDGMTWTQMNVAGPTSPKSHMYALPNLMTTFDGAVVLFAGFEEAGDPGATWTWNGRSWTQLDVPGPNVLEGPFQAAAMSAW